MSAEPFSVEQLDVIEWAAAECERQRSGERSVAWMLNAWQWAMNPDRNREPLTEAFILMLGELVEPTVNAKGYRKVDVRVGYSRKGPWEEVPRQMTELVAAAATLKPDEWYRQYEEIHPFRDGNGRTGSILWNRLRSSLAEPEVPPDFWKDLP